MLPHSSAPLSFTLPPTPLASPAWCGLTPNSTSQPVCPACARASSSSKPLCVALSHTIANRYTIAIVMISIELLRQPSHTINPIDHISAASFRINRVLASSVDYHRQQLEAIGTCRTLCATSQRQQQNFFNSFLGEAAITYH
ncbi:hypothetical protein ES332_D02G127400v1 [Gossypium tomentosum]|uniref:Uncharacterized protein n=1 Tax=Gossypium tomentosum TaxID=34277 RepID=A0A5D2LWC3_GOSTO|nr:hypothetical protein ES332_D02G127400v1 [Gossypium tomentosum]